MKQITLLSGSGHPELAEGISKRLGIPLSRVNLKKFSNLETSVEIIESVRGMDVFIFQSFECKSLNHLLMEVLILVNACKIASAAHITVVLPYFPYSKQPSGPYDKLPPGTATASTRWSEVGHAGSSSSGLLSPLTRSVTSLPSSMNQSNYSSFEMSRTKSTNGSYSGNNTYRTWRARSGKLMANLISKAGADHVLTMDLHDPQYEGFFSIPVDNLRCEPIFLKYLSDHFEGKTLQEIVIVSPDAGGAKRALSFSEKLGVDFALVHKEHPRGKGSRTRHDKSTSLVSQFKQNNEVPLFAPKASPASPDTSPEDLDSEIPTSLHINVPFKQLDTNILALSPSTLEIVANLRLVGDVSGRTVVLVDDIVDTCSTLIKAASLCLLHGASRVWAIVTHGIFSANALDLLQASSIEQIIVSSSLPQATTEILNLKFPKLKIVDVAPLFAEAIRRTHYGESVSLLFDRVPI